MLSYNMVHMKVMWSTFKGHSFTQHIFVARSRDAFFKSRNYFSFVL